MRRLTRWTIAATLGLGLTVGRPSAAHASDFGDSIATAAVVVLGIAIADATFATYDIVVAGKGQLPSHGWTIAEIVVTAPQTLIGNGALWGFGTKEEEGYITALAIPLMGVTALTTHGIWGTAISSSKVPATSLPTVSSSLAGVSSAIGINTTLTGYDLGRLFRGKLGIRSMGVAEMLMTTPTIAVSGVQVGTGASNRGAWIALTAWSSVLFAHGLASAIWGGHHEDPEPPPAAAPDQPPPADPPGDRSKPPLQVPASIQLGPTIVTDGVARVPGVGVVGVF